MQTKIKSTLAAVRHPATGEEVVCGVNEREGVWIIEVALPRERDPFQKSIARQIETIMEEFAPGNYELCYSTPAPAPSLADDLNKIGKTIVITSSKGGVGKSTVVAGIAEALVRMGYRVGLLDADIYGPSQPLLFDIPNHTPEGVKREMGEYIIPAISRGVKLSSIAFFVGADVPLAWRGPMAVNALKQLARQTLWEELDFLLVDMPPGTGDIQLSIANELRIDGAVIVSTPQQLALADTLRGVRLWSEKGIEVPVLGIIENMAYFSPPDLPGRRYHIFGEGGARRLAQAEGIPFLGEIPISDSNGAVFDAIAKLIAN